MTWARFDDGIYDHPKVIQAGRDARELFFASVVYSSRHLTDGLIPRGALRILQAWTEIDDTAACADRLIEVGLWESDGVSFRIHDFLVYQPSKEEVEEKREARAEAGRKGGRRSGEVRAGKAQAKREAQNEANEANEANREAFASENAKQNRSKIEANHEANAKQNRTPSQTRPISPSEVTVDSLGSGNSIIVADAGASGDVFAALPAPDEDDSPSEPEPSPAAKERKPLTTFAADAPAMRLAVKLRDGVLAHTPTAQDANKARHPAGLQAWARKLDALMQDPRRAPPDVEAVIAYALAHEQFWQAKVLNPDKVKKHFDTINSQRLAEERRRAHGYQTNGHSTAGRSTGGGYGSRSGNGRAGQTGASHPPVGTPEYVEWARARDAQLGIGVGGTASSARTRATG